jgi:DNA replication protein DnaT
MAGHWIEWEKGLVRKPEVLRIARALQCTPQHAAACCMMVWEWAEDVTENGIITDVTAADASFAAGVEGIGEAMLAVGWLVEAGDALVLPNWDRHNAEPAKRRALKALYMRAYRAEKREKGLHERKRNVANS